MFSAFKYVKVCICSAVVFLLAGVLQVSHAQEVLIRKDTHSTEIFLKVSPAQIASVDRQQDSVVVIFRQPIRNAFRQEIEDNFIVSFQGTGTSFTVRFKPDADFAAFNDPEGVRFVATRQKELDNVLLSYGVGAPMLRKDNIYTEDPVLEAELRAVDTMLGRGQYQEAANRLNIIYSTANNPFYEQEALYRLGNTYMSMGRYDPDAYMDASTMYDEFVTRYPESNRVMQAQLLSAEAKEKGGYISEAINTYNNIFETSFDGETRRNALDKMADLYAGIGQYDRAIEVYEKYLDNFTTDNERVKATIGSLYLERGYRDNAYGIFSDVPVEALTETLSDAELLTFARILEEKGDDEKAASIYTYLTQDNTTQTPEALYRLAYMERDTVEPEVFMQRLQTLGEIATYTEYGLKSLIEFAEINYASRSADEWRVYLNPIYQGEDVYDLRPRAQMVQIKALYKDDDVDRLVPMIDGYLVTYPDSDDIDYLLRIKEEALYARAMQYQEEGNFPAALVTYNHVLRDFPETSRASAIAKAIDDIYFIQAQTLYDSREYEKTITYTESRLLREPPAGQRWLDLWEDATYQNIITQIGVLDQRSIRFMAREYLSQMPWGRYVSDIRQILEESFDYPYSRAFEEGRDAEVITLYDENKSWLDLWPNQLFANKARITATRSLMRMGLRDRADEMYSDITPMMSPEYAELGYSLCRSNVIYNINNLSPEEFLGLVDDSQRCNNTDYTISIARQYTREPGVSLEAQYNVMKNISDDRKRETLLNEIYAQIAENPAARFDGYEEVYFDMGLNAYRKNDFRNALMPLRRFADSASNESEKKSEALYYLGKSLMAMNEKERAFEYFEQIVNLMPDSVFKSMARSELEDDEWRRNMNRR